MSLYFAIHGQFYSRLNSFKQDDHLAFAIPRAWIQVQHGLLLPQHPTVFPCSSLHIDLLWEELAPISSQAVTIAETVIVAKGMQEGT